MSSVYKDFTMRDKQRDFRGVGTRMNLIIFDFDGTIANTSEDIVSAVNFALSKVGLEPRDKDFIWKYSSKLQMIDDILGKSNMHLTREVSKYYFQYYEKHPVDHTRLKAGVRELLEDTKGIKKVILSNKYKWLLEKILNELGIRQYFLEVFGADSFPKTKPDPYPLLQIINKYRTSKANTIFIGDSITDIIASKSAGIKCIIVPSGVTPIDKIKELKPFKIVNSVYEVEKWIK
jgi:phosphoglycolate phosphatase